MSTDILFDSAALLSLKRAQLVQLCKRYSIKASGKNVDLVARLQQYARTLPPDASFSIPPRGDFTSDTEGHVTGTETETEAEEDEDHQPQRPSEKWEVVMEDIPEEEYTGSTKSRESRADKSQAGEFGTTGSSKSTVMKALANSLGLKRSASANSNNFPASQSTDSLKASTSHSQKSLAAPPNKNNHSNGSSSPREYARDSLTTHAIPYKEIPESQPSRLPHIEPFAFSFDGAADTSLGAESLDAPVPGIGSRAGVDIESGGIGGIGTIRLITTPYDLVNSRMQAEEPPDLAPYTPAFDLVPPTPGNPVRSWPLSPEAPGEEKRLYPILNLEDVDMDDAPPSPTPANVSTMLNPPHTEPFVFGSPNPRHSASAGDFASAASSVLAEMNSRLGATGVRTLGAGILAQGPKAAGLSTDELLSYQFGGRVSGTDSESARARGEGSVSSRFDAVHERAFSRMEGIDKHYARRAVSREELAAPLPENRKRKSSVLGPDRPAGGALGKGRPPEPVSAKKRRSSTARVISAGARRKMMSGMGIPGAFGDEEDEAEAQAAESAEEEDGRGAKRACVTRPAEDGAAEVRVSIAPVPREVEREKGEDAEKTRKQNEAIKRRLELNKARRRSSRGRPSVGSHVPSTQKKGPRFGFLASAKSLVKAVWNRGAGNPSKTKADSKSKPVPTPVPAPSKPTSVSAQAPAPAPKKAPGKAVLSSAGKPPAPAATPAIGAKLTTVRVSTDRKASSSSNGLRPKLSNAISHPASDSGPGSSSGENAGDNASRDQVAPLHDAIAGSTRTRKTSTVSTLAGSTNARARLYAPTASSLAKMNESVKSRAESANVPPSAKKIAPRSRSSAAVFSPSKIPVFAPPSPRKKGHSLATASTPKIGKRRSIFSSPLMLPTSPQATSAAERGQKVNAITGAVSPLARRAPFSSAGTEAPSLAGAVASMTGTGAKDVSTEQVQDAEPARRMPSVLRKPRISRSKVIAKLGAQRERVAAAGSPRAPLGSPSANVNASGAGPAKRSGLASPKFRTRSSAGAAARRSVGNVKAHAGAGGGSGAGGIMMSAKRRARASEYARRRSAKVPVAALNFGHGDTGMDVDDA